MEPIIYGEINCVRLPGNKSVQSFIRKRVVEWIKPNFIQPTAENTEVTSVFFKVKLERMGAGHNICCRLKLWINGQWIQSTVVGNGLHTTVESCLENMSERFQELVPQTPSVTRS